MLESLDRDLLLVFGGILAVLIIGSTTTFILRRRSAAGDRPTPTVDNLHARMKSWWGMCAVFAVVLAVGPLGSIIFFALLSFLGLREFVTLAPTRPADHRALFWSFFCILPAHYLLVALKYYGLYSIFIPVYAFVFIPTVCALAGDVANYLERTAKIQWGLMLCVYCLSHVPALLELELPGYAGPNATLLLFLVIVAQSSDVLQYVCGKLFGRHKISPMVSPNKTTEGLVGGVLLATGLGTGLFWMTPFSPGAAAVLAFLICLLGFFGGLIMSAIKRDRGVKDYGSMLAGHGGIMDRLDSLCFSAPVFFHAVRYFYSP